MNNSVVWQLELVNYFVKQYNYQVIKLVDENNTQDNDFWLVNKNHERYSIIKISNKNLPLNQFQENMLKDYSVELSKLVGEYKEVLNIHVVDYNDVLESNFIAITDDSYNGEDVSMYFTNLKNILKPVNNPVEEINKITLDLNEYFKNKKTSVMQKNMPVVTLTIMFLCVVMYMLINIFEKNFNSLTESQIFFGAYYKIFIMSGDYFRFLSVGLTHGNLLHLAMNMMALYNLGRVIEPIYGKWKYLVILIVSIIGGSALSFVLDTAVVMTGISGGLFGLLGAILVYYFHSGIINNPALRSNLVSILIINLFISFLPGIALYGHLGGFIGGVLVGILFTENKNWKSLRTNTLISMVILTLILGYKTITVDKTSLEGIYVQTDIELLKNYKAIGLDSYVNHLEKNLIEIYKYY